MQPIDGLATGSDSPESAKLANVGITNVADGAATTAGSATSSARSPKYERRTARSRLMSAVRWLGSQSASVVLALSLLNGLIVSSVLIVLSTPQLRTAWGGLFNHPVNALAKTWDYLSGAYVSLFEGSVFNPHSVSVAFAHPSSDTLTQALLPIGNTITDAVPLAISGMGLAIAYRSGVFNIGAASQVILGGIGASWVAFSFPSMPTAPHVALAFAGAIAAGAAGGLIPGILRATTGASEVIVTIMMNYVLANVLTYLLSNTFFRANGRGTDDPLGRSTLPNAALTNLVGNWPVNAGVFVAIAVLALGAILLNRSRLGFEFLMAGASARAARMAGVRQAMVYVLAFAISGGIVGLAGGVQILGVTPQLQVGFGDDIGGLAILVAFVGANRPLGVALAALLYGALESGGLTMQLSSGVSYQLTGVMQALIVMFVTAPALVASVYRLQPDRTVGTDR